MISGTGQEMDAARFLYLSINVLILFFPFVLSFHPRVQFYRRWGSLVPAYLVVSIPFIIWDMFMIKYDHWGFKEDYILGWRLFHTIPVEEVLFFFTVPYACTFTYEAIRTLVPEKTVPFSSVPFIFIGILSILAAIPFIDQGYTASILVAMGIVMIASPLISPDLFRSWHYYIFLTITMGLFLVFNYILTSIPVVWYWHGSIWGGDGAWNGRFITIPYEDFLYNIALLTGFLAIYHRFRASRKGTAEMNDMSRVGDP